jgi:hypothetical protein
MRGLPLPLPLLLLPPLRLATAGPPLARRLLPPPAPAPWVPKRLHSPHQRLPSRPRHCLLLRIHGSLRSRTSARPRPRAARPGPRPPCSSAPGPAAACAARAACTACPGVAWSRLAACCLLPAALAGRCGRLLPAGCATRPCIAVRAVAAAPRVCLAACPAARPAARLALPILALYSHARHYIVQLVILQAGEPGPFSFSTGGRAAAAAAPRAMHSCGRPGGGAAAGAALPPRRASSASARQQRSSEAAAQQRGSSRISTSAAMKENSTLLSAVARCQRGASMACA